MVKKKRTKKDKKIKVIRKKREYDDDKFLQKIQQPKMRELWKNKEDEVWEKENIL